MKRTRRTERSRRPVALGLALMAMVAVVAGCQPTPGTGTGSGPCDRVASTTGSDGDAGTVDAPWRTAQHLADQLTDGQVGCLRAGTYDTDDSIVVRHPRTTLTSYDGERASLKGRVYVPQGADGVTVSHLDLDERSSYDIGPVIDAAYTTFDDDDVTNHHTGICFILGGGGAEYGRASHTVIQNSRIHDCGVLPSTNQDHGIYVAGADDTIIRNNWIYDNADRGIQLYPDAQHTEIYGNVIDGNGEGVSFGGDGDFASSDNSVHNNVISNSNIRWNVDANWPAPPNSTTPLIGSGNVVENNCLWATNSNDYYNQQGGIVVDDQPGFSTSGNLIADPMFTDRSGKDFRLHKDSPCDPVYP